MMKLLQNYSLAQIIIFLVLFAVAFKEVISFFQWGRDNGIKFFQNKYQRPQENRKKIEKLIQVVDNLNKKVDILLDSDKDDIKTYIIKQHHYFCYKLKKIDAESLDGIQLRYSHYQQQGGNSYIYNLMEDLRALPIVESKEIQPI